MAANPNSLAVTAKRNQHVYPTPPPPFHYYKRNANSSMRTRAAAGEMLRIIEEGTPHRPKVPASRKHARKKRIDSLPIPSFGDPVDTPDDKSFYFVGNVDNVPMCLDGKAWCPVSSLSIASNTCGEGSSISGIFTLLPKEKTLNVARKGTFHAFKNIVSKAKGSNIRGVHRQPEFESENHCRYITFGAYAPRSQTGISDSMKGVDLMKKEYKEVSCMMNDCENVVSQYLPAREIVAIKRVKDLLHWPGFLLAKDNSQSTIWSAIACSINGFLPAHVDNNFFWSVSMALSESGDRSELLTFFCFPEYGIAVPLCHGDVIVFNPRVQHCVSTRKTTSDIVCLSLYLKTSIVGGNDNDLPLTEEQLKVLRENKFRL